jgi:HAD superfamily hydrolase (TIGR01549 family)
MIKAIIFDFGQTLVDSSYGFRHAEKNVQAAIFQDLSISEHDSFKHSYRRIRKDFHHDSKLSRINMWKAVYWEYGREAPLYDLRKWELDYWQTVERYTKVFPEVPNILTTLSARYDHLALITNTQGQADAQAHRFTSYPDLAALFSVMIVAGENGVLPKPDAQPFVVCLEQLGVAADEAVYVGDDWRNDVNGSRNAGLHPVWLKHHSVNRKYPEVDEDAPVITTLTELPPQLETSQKALQERDLRPIGQPKIEVVEFEDDAELEFTMSLEVML